MKENITYAESEKLKIKTKITRKLCNERNKLNNNFVMKDYYCKHTRTK